MKRRNTKLKSVITSLINNDKQEIFAEFMEVNNSAVNSNNTVINSGKVNESSKKMYKDQECEANIFFNRDKPEKMFICNRYIYNNDFCDAEIQTDIENTDVIKIHNQKRFKDKQCGTPQKTFADQSVEPDINIIQNSDIKSFCGFKSISNDQQLLDLGGVSFENFEFLLKRLKDNTTEKCRISAKNRLLIFLVKMKTGLSFSAISVLFSVHRSTISRIFYSTLQVLACATSNIVFWPDKDVVQGTMPKCFYPNFADTRVIIDCTELRIEVPASVDNRVYTYSHYKKGFTAKLLIGITPSGFISFKSKVAGGRKSDSQMTIESGLVDLLEDGDVVLADKGFPDIRRTIDKAGKQVVLIMPPFLEKKDEFTKKETEETYHIAKVRIHIERIMQRLRTYQILNKIPENLFSCIDDIVHMCCVLVNLQPPIISDEIK